MPRKKKAPVNPRNFVDQPDEYVLGIVLEDIMRSQKFMGDKVEDFRKWYKMYNAKLEDGERRQNGSNLFIPYIYSTIETAIPKLLGSVFDSTPFIAYKPVTGEDEEKAACMTALVEYQMKQKMNSATNLYSIFKDAILYGTAISKQTWKYEEKEVVERKRVPTEIPLEDGSLQNVEKLQGVKTKKVMYDAPVMAAIPVDKFYFDPAYTDIQSSPWVAHEYSKELYQLIEGEEKGMYKNTRKITADENANNGSKISNKIGTMRDGVKIYEYWTDDWKVMVANDAVVIQCIPNPFFHKTKPFTKWCPVPMPNEFYGKSMVESLTDLQAELNTLRNQRIDNVSMALNRMFLINKNADIDTSQLVSRPNGFIEVDNVVEDIKELGMSDVTSSAYTDEEIVKGDMDVTSGVHSYDRGQAADRRDTATVANLLTSASSERFKLQVMMMEEDPMNNVGMQLAELNKQYLTDEVLVRITQEGKEVDQIIGFDDIDAEFDVIACGTAIEPSVNKEVRQSQLIQLLNTATNVEGINMVGLMKRIFEEFEFKNIDDMLLTEEEMTPEDQMAGMTEEDMLAMQQQGVDPNAMQQQPPTDGTSQGLPPQMGGVGSMAQYLQNPNV